MRKFLRRRWGLLTVIAVVLGTGVIFWGAEQMVWADDEAPAEEQTEGSEEASDDQISISISPVMETFELKSSSTYDGVLQVSNPGKVAFNFEVYSAPYSIASGEGNNDYQPSFSTENNYTQIARWITVKNKDGQYVSSIENGTEVSESHPVFTAAPGETVDVAYRITTPDNIPAGGQYATLFARTMPEGGEGSGINALANLGMKIFGRSEDGEAIQAAEIQDLKIAQTLEEDKEVEENGALVTKTTTSNKVNGYALVKNIGNLDFAAYGKLTVTSIFGGDPYYETPEGEGQVSIIPESELPISDVWEETPSFGLFKATWTVTAGSETETVEMVVCLIPPFVIVISIILLTIIIAWIIIMVRRRKERRSRFTI